MHLWHHSGQLQGATYVEASVDFEKDAGSTPATSTKSKLFDPSIARSLGGMFTRNSLKFLMI